MMNTTLAIRDALPSLLSETSDLQPYSCAWCRRIVIDPDATVKLSSHIRGFTVGIVEEDIRSASRDGCAIFVRITRDISSSNCRTSDTVFLLFELIFDTQFVLQLSDARDSDRMLVSVRVSHHMQDPISIPTLVETYREFPKSVVYQASFQYDDPTANFLDPDVELPYVITNETYQWLREYLDVCDTTHTECGEWKFRRDSDSMPSRLVKIDNLSNNVQIVSISDYSNIRFAALSYCWGGDDSMKLTRENLELWNLSLSRSELPKTLSDAITFTMKLGLQYIWIDRLCIIQDDEEDKAREIARMPGIFYGAYVTVSANDASHCAEGFLQSFDKLAKKVQSVTALRYTCPDRGEGRIMLNEFEDKSLADVRDVGGFVNLRAWTLQEQELSRRLISCKYDGVEIRCLQSAVSHEVQVSAPFSINHVTSMLPEAPGNILINRVILSEGEMMQQWNYLVAKYSRRKLTYPEDKLPALSATADCFLGQLRIAEQYSLVRGPNYLAGLWDSQFPTALLWTVNLALSPRPSSYRAPSWSWAAVDDEIIWKDEDTVLEIARVPSLIILDAGTTPKHSFAPYGQITAGHLKVKGNLMEGIWHGVRNQNSRPLLYRYSVKIKGNETWSKSIKVQPDSRDEDMLRDRSNPQRVYFLLVGSKLPYGPSGPITLCGLIIVPVQDGLYQRVGLFLEAPRDTFKSSEYREIILV